jgi:hypothetical protein
VSREVSYKGNSFETAHSLPGRRRGTQGRNSMFSMVTTIANDVFMDLGHINNKEPIETYVPDPSTHVRYSDTSNVEMDVIVLPWNCYLGNLLAWSRIQ